MRGRESNTRRCVYFAKHLHWILQYGNGPFERVCAAWCLAIPAGHQRFSSTHLLDRFQWLGRYDKDHPAKCQEEFCEAPSQESFKRWCLASTLDTRHRSGPTSQEKSCEEFLVEEESQNVSRALFKGPVPSSSTSDRKRPLTMEEPVDPLDQLFDLQEKKMDDAMTKLSQVASCS